MQRLLKPAASRGSCTSLRAHHPAKHTPWAWDQSLNDHIMPRLQAIDQELICCKCPCRDQRKESSMFLNSTRPQGSPTAPQNVARVSSHEHPRHEADEGFPEISKVSQPNGSGVMRKHKVLSGCFPGFKANQDLKCPPCTSQRCCQPTAMPEPSLLLPSQRSYSRTKSPAADTHKQELTQVLANPICLCPEKQYMPNLLYCFGSPVPTPCLW